MMAIPSCGMRCLALLLVAGLAGCSATGEPGGNKRFSDENVPFTFDIPADFTEASVDGMNSRGDVIAGAGLSKVDVLAVRRIASGDADRGPVAHEVLGKQVVSELHPLQGDYYLECQYTPDRAEKVREACRTAVASVRSK
jgi:hypothetical protein